MPMPMTKCANSRVTQVWVRISDRYRDRIGTPYFLHPNPHTELADALGLTPVHVNRVLQDLRKDGLLDFKRSLVTMNDVARVAELSDFDPLYLHQSCGEPQTPGASDDLSPKDRPNATRVGLASLAV